MKLSAAVHAEAGAAAGGGATRRAPPRARAARFRPCIDIHKGKVRSARGRKRTAASRSQTRGPPADARAAAARVARPQVKQIVGSTLTDVAGGAAKVRDCAQALPRAGASSATRSNPLAPACANEGRALAVPPRARRRARR